MSDFGVFAYCAAMGFVAAATIATFYQWVTSEARRALRCARELSGLAFAVVLSMFCGPFIVVRKVVTGLRSREL